MSPEEASQALCSRISIVRDDIARAKAFVVGFAESRTDGLAGQWVQSDFGETPSEVDIHSAGAADTIDLLARAFSLRLAFYQAIWELVSAGELLPAGEDSWSPKVAYRTPHEKGGLRLRSIKCVFPASVLLPPLASVPSVDPDIFLQGADCLRLPEGIREAVAQSLACFQRGLYLPAIVMLAAGTEACWVECGTAVGLKLGDKQLTAVLDDAFASLSRKVAEVKRALQRAGAKSLLKTAGTSLPKVTDAEVWTTTLRERRNAVHWGKARNFIAQHSDAASLLLATPLHLGTLESVRRAAQ